MIYKAGEAFEVEFMTLSGETFALETLRADESARLAARKWLRPAKWHELRAASRLLLTDPME